MAGRPSASISAKKLSSTSPLPPPSPVPFCKRKRVISSASAEATLSALPVPVAAGVESDASAFRARAHEALKALGLAQLVCTVGAVTAKQRAAIGLGSSSIDRLKRARALAKSVLPLALNSVSVSATPKCSCSSQSLAFLASLASSRLTQPSDTMNEIGASTSCDSCEKWPSFSNSAHGCAASLHPPDG